MVCLSEAEAADLRATYGPIRPRVEVIPNGVDLERFRPPTPDERLAARTELKLGTEERVAVFVGHEFSRKGLSFAIQGLPHAPSVLLLVVGGNDDIIAERLRRGEGRSASATASCSSARAIDLVPFLHASDIFVLPSAYEANALVVLEALAAGCPVIATPVGFAPEVVVDGVNGFLVERDGRAVGERMRAARDDRGRRARRMGSACARVRRAVRMARDRRTLPRARRGPGRRACARRFGASGRTRRRMTHIVQIAPTIGPGSGVAGVAYALEREFIAAGATVERFTAADAGRPPQTRRRGARSRRHPSHAGTQRHLVQHGRHAASATIPRRTARTPSRSRHNDVMAGDIYVNHGLLQAAMRARGDYVWRMVRNPVHLFTALRDRIRYRGRTHRAVVALTTTEAELLVSTYGRVRAPIHVIPNGVDIERFRPPDAAERAQARARLGVDDDRTVAVFIGHEFERKGLPIAIDGAARGARRAAPRRRRHRPR